MDPCSLNKKYLSSKKIFTQIIVYSIAAIFILLITKNTKAEIVSNKEYCTAFEEIAFSSDQDYLRRWESEELRIFLAGDKYSIQYSEDLLKQFGKLTGKKITFTNEDVNLGLIYTDDLYKDAFLHGEALFGRAFNSKEKLFDFIKSKAKEDSWYLLEQYDSPKTKGRVFAFALNEILTVKDHPKYQLENERRVNVALTNLLFPRPKNSNEYIRINDVEDVFLPLSNEKQFPIVEIWYDQFIKSGMKKNDIVTKICK